MTKRGISDNIEALNIFTQDTNSKEIRFANLNYLNYQNLNKVIISESEYRKIKTHEIPGN
jgi:hypothetical protein